MCILSTSATYFDIVFFLSLKSSLPHRPLLRIHIDKCVSRSRSTNSRRITWQRLRDRFHFFSLGVQYPGVSPPPSSCQLRYYIPCLVFVSEFWRSLVFRCAWLSTGSVSVVHVLSGCAEHLNTLFGWLIGALTTQQERERGERATRGQLMSSCAGNQVSVSMWVAQPQNA